MAKPLEINWKVFQYLKGNLNFGVKYVVQFDVELEIYFDSNLARNPDEQNQLHDMHSALDLELWHGVARNNQLLICDQLKMSIKLYLLYL